MGDLTTADLDRLAAATSGLTPPFAVVDLEAFHANADDLVRRAGGLPVRVASKSVRVRALLDETLARPGFRGTMAYAVREAIWLVRQGATDVLVGYPTADRHALATVSEDPVLAREITLMVDSLEHLELVAASAPGVSPCASVSTSTPRCGSDPPTSACAAHPCAIRARSSRSPARCSRPVTGSAA